jgi:hypothetical protein
VSDQIVPSSDEALAEPLKPKDEHLEEEDGSVDEERPERRSDAGDPWHGLNDFED